MKALVAKMRVFIDTGTVYRVNDERDTQWQEHINTAAATKCEAMLVKAYFTHKSKNNGGVNKYTLAEHFTMELSVFLSGGGDKSKLNLVLMAEVEKVQSAAVKMRPAKGKGKASNKDASVAAESSDAIDAAVSSEEVKSKGKKGRGKKGRVHGVS